MHCAVVEQNAWGLENKLMGNSRSARCTGIAICAAALFSACTTLQDDYRSTVAGEHVQQATASYEETLVTLDAELFLSDLNQIYALRLKEFIGSVAQQRKSGTDRNFEARMLALEGRAELLAHNASRARKLYEEAVALQPGDTQVHVLAIRLAEKGIAEIIENAFAVADDTKPLLIEQALFYYAQGEFSQSAAAFDAAFRELPEYYQSAYRTIRDTAWNLRTVSGTQNVNLLTKETISPADALSIAQAETRLLNRWNNGRILRASDLVKKLSAAGIVEKDFLSRQNMRRVDCAQLLWNVYAILHNSAVDYAAEFKSAGITESPIADVALDEAAFNAVAGVVENEIMPLTDGVHFEPQKTVRGTDFAAWAKSAER